MTTLTEITQRNHRRVVRFFWGLLIGATLVSLIGNVVHAVLPYIPRVVIQIGAAAVPPIALLAAVHGIALAVRAGASGRVLSRYVCLTVRVISARQRLEPLIFGICSLSRMSGTLDRRRQRLVVLVDLVTDPSTSLFLLWVPLVSSGPGSYAAAPTTGAAWLDPDLGRGRGGALTTSDPLRRQIVGAADLLTLIRSDQIRLRLSGQLCAVRGPGRADLTTSLETAWTVGCSQPAACCTLDTMISAEPSIPVEVAVPVPENPPSQARISGATAHESDQQKVSSSTAFTPAYAGDITPEQAWKLLSENPEAVLVDVRTDAEWRFVGAPDLASLGREVVYIEWNSVDGKRNENFVAELAKQVPAHTDRPVVFLCRSGNRSIGAAEAATEAGIAPSYNVLDGFEGHLDGDSHRGGSGWRAIGLPWKQT
jgi:rhodanese-related sulfurtransferase